MDFPSPLPGSRPATPATTVTAMAAHQRTDSHDNPGSHEPGRHDPEPVHDRRAKLKRAARRMDARIRAVRPVHPQATATLAATTTTPTATSARAITYF
jgi:hypothetical protein